MNDPGIFGNVFLVIFLFWPGVTIGAALLNMLITFKFSWSELIIDYLIGLAIGICFYYGTIGDVSHAEHFFLMVSTGVAGLFKWVGIWPKMSVGEFFMICAIWPASAVIVTALLDYAAVSIGWVSGQTGAKTGNVFLSILLLGCKWPFALITSVVGLVIGLIGMIVRATQNNPQGGGFGFVGGAFWFEWGLNTNKHATTFGCVINVFKGEISDVLGHELVHTRQYIYMHDWLGVFYFTIAGIWGAISREVATNPGDAGYFRAHGTDEIGNPIEIVPEHKY